jgi:hypothetical protein
VTEIDLFEESPHDPAAGTERVLQALEKNTGTSEGDLSPSFSERGLRTVCCADGSLTPEQLDYCLKRAIDQNCILSYRTDRQYHFVRRDAAHLIALAEQWGDARHHQSARDRLRQLIETVSEADDLGEAATQQVVAAANGALQKFS